MNNKYYITTAIVYTSAKPHIGNTYDVVLADSIARFKRFQGYDVFFMTGTDEHGEKIEKKAQEAGISPKEYVDNIAEQIKKIWALLNTSYDKFIRTTDEEHVKQVQKMFQKFYEQGDIYKGTYEGWYCTPCESFFTDSQLEDGKCPDCHREVYKMTEEAYFFRMSKYSDQLLQYIEEHPEFIEPVSRKNEMVNNFLKPGLKDLCVSRSSFTWGIPVEFDNKHVVYVWLDALTNYITGIGYNVEEESSERYKKLWPADLHVIGKDIVRFHVIYWPIFLMALGEKLPKKVFGHPWLLASKKDSQEYEGEKMSKSKGNVLYPDDLIDIFGTDGIRFYLLHEMPYDNDGQVSLECICEKYNSELANVLGNLVSRTISMVNKYNQGIVEKNENNTQEEQQIDNNFISVIKESVSKSINNMNSLHVSDALDNVFDIFRRANKYIDETMPWVLAKDEQKKDRLNTVLYNLVEAITIGSCILSTYMPQTSEKILKALHTEIREYASIQKLEFGVYPNKNQIDETIEILFQRKDIKEVMELYYNIISKNA